MKIELSNLTCTRGDVRVLHNVNFALKSRQIALLLGGNGAGKTTLLRVLAGLSAHSAGRIDMDRDESVFLAHSDGLKPSLTLAENMAFWAGVYGAETRLDAVMTDLNLLDLRDCFTHHLSAGQRRRAAFGRVLLAEAKIWLLDEPFTALDKINIALIETLINRHCHAGGIAIISTHHGLDLAGAIQIDLSAFTLRAGMGAEADYWGLDR